MRKSPLIALAALAFFALAGTASAADLTDQSTVTFNVESMCAFNMDQESIDGEASLENDGEYLTSRGGYNASGSLTIVCSTGTPYTVQVDSEAGGSIPLTGANTSGTVPAHIYQGMDSSGPSFGTTANSESYAGTGNGDYQQVDYAVAVNFNEFGESLPIPAVDNYSRVLNWTVSY